MTDALAPEANTQPQAAATETPGVEVPGVGQVPMEELVKGYMRQSDYTQKTQGVASQREELELAQSFISSLDENPEATIRALAEEYGVSFGEAAAAVGAVDVAVDEEESTISTTVIPPELRAELDELKSFKTSVEQERLQVQLTEEIRSAKDEFGDFPEAEVLHVAVRDGIPNIRAAYKTWAFDKAKQEGVEEGLRQGTAREDATVERGAAPGGPSVPAVNSIEDAFAVAERIAANRKR